MMMFRVLKTNLIDILDAAAGGRFVVVGHQKQVTAASEVKGSKRRVEVFFESGEFPEDKGAYSGPVQHDITFRVELTVSEAAQGDLSVINDESSSAAQISTAIQQFKTAASKADDSIDELFDIVWNTLMDANNIDIGTEAPFRANSRWAGRLQKNEPVPQGEYVVLTGDVGFTCQALETIGEDTGTAQGSGAYDSTIDLDGDDVEQTGVTV